MDEIARETIIQAASGDADAFEQIYRATADFVYTIAWRMTHNHQEAQEITQEVFIKAYRKLGRFGFRSSFKTWLYRIAVNTAINASRKRAIERQSVPYDDSVAAVHVADTRDPLTQKEDREQSEALVQSLLSLLSPEQRACIVLRNIEGLSYQDIARTLGININTVRTRLKRARQKLYDSMKKGVIHHEV